jgi:hypothetical protein
MAGGYKVRLADGSEIGPMDLEAVRSWFAQGLIERDSPVLKPGSTRWTRLSEVLGGSAQNRPPARGPARKPAFRTTSTRLAPRRSGPARDEAAWPTRAAGALFLLGAAAAFAFDFFPERWISSLARTPFKEIAAFELVLGLAVLAGWGLARKFARIALLVAAFALLPVAGVLIASGAARDAFLVLGSALVLSLGFFGLLGEEVASPAVPIASLAGVLAGALGIAVFGWTREGAEGRRVREWSAPERHFADAGADFSVDVPPGWVILRKEQDLVAVPPESRLVLAEPRLGGFAYLAVEKGDAPTLDELLSRFLAARRKAHPELKEISRSDVTVGHLAGREARGTWDAGGGKPVQDRSVVWKDGWVSIALAEWLPEAPPSPGAFDALLRGISSEGTFAVRLQAAVEAAVQEVPHLSANAVEVMMARSAARVLEPQEVFRRSCEWANRGIPSLSPREAREMTDLNAQVFSALPARDRGRLAGYFERVRGRRPTSADEDRDMGHLMKGGVLRLPAPRLARLQALYEKLIRAASDQA